MLLKLNKKAKSEDLNNLIQKLQWMGFTVSSNKSHHLAILKGIDEKTHIQKFQKLDFVEEVTPFKNKFKLVSREFHPENTIIEIRGKKIGGDAIVMMAGPCTIESKEQIEQSAQEAAKSGATVLRGGAFKPRTSPYDFQGLGEEGLKYLKEAADKHNLLTISEIMDPDDLEMMEKYVDILQVGARNMQNFSLLKKLAKSKTPVFLKRGFSATYQDFLMAAEYIVGGGNPNVILCERGIRTFETYARNTLDVAAVPILKSLTHLPIALDPSHGTGIREMVSPMAKAGVAAGADVLMIEMHPNPDQSVSDAKQTVSFDTFSEIMQDLKVIAKAVNRSFG